MCVVTFACDAKNNVTLVMNVKMGNCDVAKFSQANGEFVKQPADTLHTLLTSATDDIVQKAVA